MYARVTGTVAKKWRLIFGSYMSKLDYIITINRKNF